MDDLRAILVTGAFGSGKSTVVEDIADLLEDTRPPYAAIDLDWLCWSNAPGAGHGEHELLARNLGVLVASYRAAGVRRLVMAGSIADAAAIDALEDAVGVPVHVVRLAVPIAVIEERLLGAPTLGRAGDLERSRAWLAAGTGEGLEDDAIDNTGPVREAARRVLRSAGWPTP